MLVGLRFVASIAGRMVFSFMPAITRGTGLSIEQMGTLLFARDLTGLLATVVGRLTDRFGNWRSMFVGGLTVSISLGLSMFGATGLIIGVLLFGLGRLGLHVGMNSWVADEVSFERRGQATGLIELTWALSAFVGIPLTGLLIDAFGWQSAFLVPAVLAFGLTLLQRPPQDEQSLAPFNTPADNRPKARLQWSTNVVATLCAPALLLGAAQFIFFGHGFWLEETYGFDASRIGFALIAVGAAEFCGSLASSRFTDRIGKRRSILAGTSLMMSGVVGLLIAASPPLALGLALLVVTFFGFEYAIVSSLPLTAELSTTARAHVIGWAVGVGTVAKALVALVAGRLYESSGFEMMLALALACAAAAVTVTLFAIKEPGARPAPGSPAAPK